MVFSTFISHFFYKQIQNKQQTKQKLEQSEVAQKITEFPILGLIRIQWRTEPQFLKSQTWPCLWSVLQICILLLQHQLWLYLPQLLSENQAWCEDLRPRCGPSNESSASDSDLGSSCKPHKHIHTNRQTKKLVAFYTTLIACYAFCGFNVTLTFRVSLFQSMLNFENFSVKLIIWLFINDVTQVKGHHLQKWLTYS